MAIAYHRMAQLHGNAININEGGCIPRPLCLNFNLAQAIKISNLIFLLITLWTFSACLLAKPNNRSVENLLQSAIEEQARGELKKAFRLLEEASALLEHNPNPITQALLLGRLSDGYLLARRDDEAIRYANQGVAVARRTNIPNILATTLNHLANAQMAMQDYPTAVINYRQAVRLAETTTDDLLQTSLLTNLIHALLANETPSTGLPALKTALTKALALPDSHEKIYGLIALAHLAQRLGILLPIEHHQLFQSAKQALSVARALAEKTADSRAKSYATGHLGELLVVMQHYQQAAPLLRQALFFAAETNAPELSARWNWQLGRLFRATGNLTSATQAYRQALEYLASIHSALVFGQRGHPQFFRETIGAIHLELAEILLKEGLRAKLPEQRQQALREVRMVMERYKAAELQNYFQDPCVATAQQRHKARDLDSLMSDGIATLYPIVFPERLILLISFAHGEIQVVDIPVKAGEIKEAVMKFHEQLTPAGNPRQLRRQGLSLHDWLIKPISALLLENKVNTLVIVAEDILRTIPFAALYDGEEFLINRYALAITPGLTLTENSQSSTKERPLALIGGISESVQGFTDLPYVDEEIKTLSTYYENTQLINRSFIKPQIQAELQQSPYRVITFATHTYISRDPRQSYLLTYDDKITFNELESFIRIRQFGEKMVDLLVLSACETAAGDERAALGLAGIAVKAGANSVMASLWPVNDASTASLVSNFFKHLQQHSVTKAKALQLAQQKMLADSQYQHPYYWAPFVLIGNWN